MVLETTASMSSGGTTNGSTTTGTRLTDPPSSSTIGLGDSNLSKAVMSSNDFFVSSLACVLTHLVSLRGGAGNSGIVNATAPPDVNVGVVVGGSSLSPSTSQTSAQLTVFHAIRVPNVSIQDYLFRIARYFICSPECFVMSLIYIDRVMKKHPEFLISKLNIHRLIVTSMMLAAKFFDDVYYSNAYYAKVGGVRGPEMNVLEIHFLKLIEWQLYVSPEEFDLYKTNVLLAVSGGNTAKIHASNMQTAHDVSNSNNIFPKANKQFSDEDECYEEEERRIRDTTQSIEKQLYKTPPVMVTTCNISNALTVKAGPLESNWNDRLREELLALVEFIESNSATSMDWFSVKPINETGTKWSGKCWTVYEHKKYEFTVQFEIPVAYPGAPIEIELPELDGKSSKMYRGGKICMDIHFAPLWRSNTPRYGIIHALCFALGPWLAAEIPHLVNSGVI